MKQLLRAVSAGWVMAAGLLLLAGGAGAAEPGAKHFLWSVTTGRNTIYLAGSLHVLSSEAYPLAPVFDDAYRKSHKLVFETDMQAMKAAASQTALLSSGMYLDGQTLAQNISPETLQLVKRKARKTSLGFAELNHFKPWYCALQLVSRELQSRGFEPQHGIDAYFFDKAIRDGKETLSLETLSEQQDAFLSLNNAEQEQFLQQALKEFDVIASMAKEMFAAWQHGDTEDLSRMMRLSYQDYPRIYKRFIVERNAKWLRKIQKLAGTKYNYLVVVGAGHLPGADGLVPLLRNAGYRVEQR